jgi:hypothetical protein
MTGGHVLGNIVGSVVQVTSGHVGVVSIGQSVTLSFVQGGHTVGSVVQVTSGHVGIVSIGQSVTLSVVQGGHTVVGSVVQGGHSVCGTVGSVVHIKASVVPAGKKMVF